MADNNTETSAILRSLQKLKERELTEDFLMPLLKSFGYERVEYHGGPTEEGKDIVCWRTDELQEVELAVAQVKRYKLTRRAADKRSFSEIVTQLSQAVEKRVPHVDGGEYFPEIIYFITPYTINTAILQNRFEGFQALRSRRVKIIDGPKLVKLIQRRLPELMDQLLDTKAKLHHAIVGSLTNRDLMQALEALPYGREVSSFYTDIDFFLGKKSTRLIFLGRPNGTVREHSRVAPADWERFCELRELATKELQIDLLKEPAGQVEDNYLTLLSKLKKWESESRKILDQVADLESENNRIDAEIKQKRKELATDHPDLFRKHTNLEKIQGEIEELEQEMHDESVKKSEYAADRERLVRMHSVITKELDDKDPILRPVQKVKQKHMRQYRVQRKKQQELSKHRPESGYRFTVDGERLAAAIKDSQEWIQGQIDLFNQSSPTIPELRTLLRRCEVFFATIKDLTSIELVAETVTFRYQGDSTDPRPLTRLSVPIHDVFDTGLNVTVLGEAGAGKTTALQMYAYKRLQRSGKEFELILYVPLARAVRLLNGDSDHDQRLENGIIRYFNSMGVRIHLEDLAQELESRGGVLLLDGVDEIIKTAPWILSDMKRLSSRYPKTQLITSSRVSGNYLETIPFFSVTLLPFTESQRKKFINNWFKSGDPESGKRVFSHLEENPDIATIVSNPLLATIFCILAEHNVPFPDSEIRLYDERMKLLLGHYDLYKGVSRIQTHTRDLRRLASRMAYTFHSKEMREADRRRLDHIAVQLFKDYLSEDAAKLAVGELMDPCNILVPMTSDGKHGFGHLRYQEYLAACELISNRSVDLLPLLQRDWWEGALVLFAQMNESIEWLVQRLAVTGEISVTYNVLTSMINASPRHLNLREIIEKNRELDKFYRSHSPRFDWGDSI